MKKVLLMMLVIVAIASSCKKYEYHQTLNKIYGEYTLTAYTVDGIDSLNFFNTYLGHKFSFHYDDVDCVNVLSIDNTHDGALEFFIGTWTLIKTCKVLKISSGVTSSSGGTVSGVGPFSLIPFYDKPTPEFEILTLTRKELKMQTTYNGKVYLVELKE